LFRISVLALVVFLGGWFLGGWLRRDIERDEWPPLKRVELQRIEQLLDEMLARGRRDDP